MKTVQLAFMPRDGEDWRVVSCARASVRSARCILVVPGHHVLAREIAAMGATPAQSRAAALASLAPELAGPAEQHICSLGTARVGRHLALVASRSSIDAWLEAARKAGLEPDFILPDFALLPAPAAGEARIAQRDDVIVRTPSGGFACQPDLFSSLIGSLHPVQVDFELSAIDAVRSGAIDDLPNLKIATRRGGAAPASRGLAIAASAAAAALVVASATPWLTTIRLGAATSELRAQSSAVAREALPNAKQIVDPLAQLREAMLPQLQATNGLGNATGILEGLAKSPNVQLSRLELSGDGGARASVSVADASQLQPLRDHLASLGLRSTETPGASRPNHLTIDLSVSNAP
ncbi:MAG: type II secretion system protein GspL [Hyphomonadaceae bacterium]|nr:type II secretion system protein GspL [Hyphomonadaceae bacterium]